MSKVVSIENFIAESETFPVLDVRSESEFRQGHFPGAVNIPILNDEHRREVGITYKKKGRQEAVIKGFELAGPSFSEIIKSAQKISRANMDEHPVPLLVYCWRGGMRSAIASWMLSLAGIDVSILKGGYKSFRRWALSILQQEKNILILGGMTGSGKTELLNQLAESGETVIDLEGLANHKGSAFGSLGQPPQPTNEHFENMLSVHWNKLPSFTSDQNNKNGFAWLENESRTIGHNQIPNAIYEQMRKAKVAEVKIPYEKRLSRIVSDYGSFDGMLLSEMTKKLKKRMGGQQLNQALEFLSGNDIQCWAGKMLEYYDKAYNYGMQQRQAGSVFPVELFSEDPTENLKRLKDHGNSIMKKVAEKDLTF